MNHPGVISPYSSAIVRGNRGCIALLLLLLWGVTIVPAAANDAGQYNAERFVAAIEVQGEELRARSPAAQLYQNCVYCHGEQGRAESSYYPRLAGQPVGYLLQQLNAYGDGARQNPIMSSLVKILTTEEIKLLAGYLAEQAPRAADPKLQATAAAATGKARAQALGCAACHGQAYQGQDNYARLAGQGYEYLTIQLTAFRDGDRVDPAGVMSGLAAGLSDADIDSLSRYFSAL